MGLICTLTILGTYSGLGFYNIIASYNIRFTLCSVGVTPRIKIQGGSRISLLHIDQGGGRISPNL